MQTPISLQNLDRTIFELIRLRAVANEAIPDITSFTGTPQEVNAAYQAEKETMLANNKTIIELYGTSVAAIRDTKTQEKIVIDRKSIGIANRATIGNYIVPNGDNFQEKKTIDDNNVTYEIRVIASTVKSERLAYKIISEALGSGVVARKSIIDSGEFEGEYFEINFQSCVNVTTLHDAMEYVYTYICPNILLLEDEIIQENIVPLIKIGVDISTKGENPQNTEIQIEIS